MPFNFSFSGLCELSDSWRTSRSGAFDKWFKDVFPQLTKSDLQELCRPHPFILNGDEWKVLDKSEPGQQVWYFGFVGLLRSQCQEDVAKQVFFGINNRLAEFSGVDLLEMRLLQADAAVYLISVEEVASSTLITLERPGVLGGDVAHFSFRNILKYLEDALKKKAALLQVNNMQPRLEVLFSIVSEMMRRRDEESTDYLDLFLTHARGLTGVNHRRWRALFPENIDNYSSLSLMQAEMAGLELVVRYVKDKISHDDFGECMGRLYNMVDGTMMMPSQVFCQLAGAWKTMGVAEKSFSVIKYKDPQGVVSSKTIDTVLATLSYKSLSQAISRAFERAGIVSSFFSTVRAPFSAGNLAPVGVTDQLVLWRIKKQVTFEEVGEEDGILMSPQAYLLQFLQREAPFLAQVKVYCLRALYAGDPNSSCQIEHTKGPLVDAQIKLEAIIEQGPKYLFQVDGHEHIAITDRPSDSVSEGAGSSPPAVVECNARFFANKNNAAQLAALEPPPSLWTRFKGP